MISCGIVRRHVDALVDGELETSVRVEFDAHMSTCPPCREHAAFSRTIKQAVRAEFGAVRAPDHLRLRVLTALQSATPPPAASSVEERPQPRDATAVPVAATRGVRVFWMPARYAVPAAAAAVLLAALATRNDGDGGEESAVAAAAVPLFEDVVRRHAVDHPTEVDGPPQQVVGWFRGKLQFPVRPVVFDGDDAHLLGARLSNVRERDAAAFYYEVHGHRVTVMVFEPPRQAFAGAQRVNVGGRVLHYRQVRGYTVPVVEHDGVGYAFTSDLDSTAMIQLAASAHLSP
jgi:anti-sigma factor (TIGR02949 family)